jgi:hypothetical protein
VLHFCSARIAWQLARENPLNIAQCPLSMAIYTLPGEPATVHLAWRSPVGDSPGARPPTPCSNASPARPPTTPAAAASATESALEPQAAAGAV